MHAMRDCDYIRRLRGKIPHLTEGLSQVSYINSISIWLLQCLEELSTGAFDSLVYFMWTAWRERNDRIFIEKFFSVNALFTQGMGTFQAYRNVRAKVKLIHKSRESETSWKCPTIGWLKANVGVVYDESIDRGG